MSKGLEQLKILRRNYCVLKREREYACDVIEKELKAFNIVKPYLKEIIGMNVYDKDFYECFLQIGNKRVFITKENYDLLKEVLA